jgi:1-acyl-sn-glycerol-3-phosphate acyltransferase
MIRRILVALLNLILRVFFRRIEVQGLERVPEDGAVLFLVNHPNGLVDPLFLFTLVPRRVSFLAKSTLFKMPVVGYLVRAVDSIPVYRKQDEGADTSKNRETFDIARKILRSGGTIGICPEGVSHSEPRLLPIKSGAARIALGAVSMPGQPIDLQIMPCGLYYTAKKSFRSSALLYFGEPFAVEPVTLDEHGEPPREAVTALNHRIEKELREVVLNAENADAMQTVDRAERIFSSYLPDEDRSLARKFEIRQRFIDGYAILRARAPERLAALVSRIDQYEHELSQVGLDPDELSVPSGARSAAFYGTWRVLVFLALLPLAVTGVVLHYPTFVLVRYLATKFSYDYDDVVSTVKIIAAALFFPLTWIVWSGLTFYFFGWKAALGVLVITPLCGYFAVLFFEELDRFLGSVRALLFFITRKQFFKRLLVERRMIREEIFALAEEAAEANV